MRKLADRVARLTGWRRAVAAMAAGAVGALAMPPFGFLPALAVSLTPAIWLLDGAAHTDRTRTLKAAALIGWCWGFGYFVAGLWWLGAAFLVEADQFAWALPLGVFGLPALLAFFPALGFILARLFWTGDATRILAFAAGLTVERMAARPSVHRISVERPRHGARPELVAHAGRLPGRISTA